MKFLILLSNWLNLDSKLPGSEPSLVIPCRQLLEKLLMNATTTPTKAAITATTRITRHVNVQSGSLPSFMFLSGERSLSHLWY